MGGVEPLRKRCLHQISEPQAQPVGAVPVAWRYQTPTGWHATTDASAALRVRHHHEVEPLYAAPQPAAPAQAGQQNHLPLAITSAPERIWLDLGVNPYEEDAHFSNLHDLTWSQDNATGDGIEYVRADLAARKPLADD